MRPVVTDRVAWSVCLAVCHNRKPSVEPIDMPFGLWTRLGPVNHLLGGVQIPREKGKSCGGKKWPIVKYRKYCPRASALGSFVKLLWLLVLYDMMKHILPLVNYYKKYCYFNTTNIFTLTFRSLSETFIRRSLFNSSSGSCHNSDATWQEIGHTCGSACSSPRLYDMICQSAVRAAG